MKFNLLVLELSLKLRGSKYKFLWNLMNLDNNTRNHDNNVKVQISNLSDLGISSTPLIQLIGTIIINNYMNKTLYI